MSDYKSKYPAITIDKENNSPNNMAYRLTVEEWYDLMHHTHNISDLIGGDGSGGDSSSDTAETIETLKKEIDELKSTVSDLTNTVEEQKEMIENISQNSGISIGDWDIDTPGEQGPND